MRINFRYDLPVQSMNIPPTLGDYESDESIQTQHLLQDVLRTALDGGDTTLFTRFSPEETMDRFREIDTLYLDLDGTSLEQGATVFPPGFHQKLIALQEAGVRIVFVTGKPETEVRALAESVPTGIALSFLYERGGYRFQKDGEGRIQLSSLLSNPATEEAATEISSVFYQQIAPVVESAFRVRLVPAGDGRHRSLISFDILRSDAPDDYDRHPRYDLKIKDPQILLGVYNRISQLLSKFPGWLLTDLGNANFELYPDGQTKDAAILQTDEFGMSTGMRMAVDDSRNGLSMLRLKDRHDRMMSAVVFNRHTPDEVVESADVAVAGEATVDVLLQHIIQAKGIGERVYVISNTPPFQKKGGAFVTSIGAPVAISRAVEGTPNSRWFFPSTTPHDFRRGDVSADRQNLFEQMVPVGITPAQHASHYGNIANKVIWKASHPDAFPDVPAFPPEDWDNYAMVNRNIAREVQSSINGSHSPVIVWVHDFQVAAIASELGNMYDRRRLKVGFFWHIPFPDPSLFIERLNRGGNRARQLLNWFSQYDVIGFHTETYVRNYHEACRQLGVKPARTIVQPISIDVQGITEQARMVGSDPAFRFESPVLNRIFETTADTNSRTEVVLNGLERADPIKGSEPRLQALLDLAQQRPELFDRKIIIESISESRTATDPLYAEYYSRCLRLIDQVNDTLSKTDVVRHITVISRRQDVIALLARVDKAMFTSVADGFNMSAPELLVTWSATRQESAQPRKMFISDQTGFVQSLTDNGFPNAVPVAQGPINRESLRHSIGMLLSGEMPEPDYGQLDAYFRQFTIQEWVKGNIRAIRNSDPGRMKHIFAEG